MTERYPLLWLQGLLIELRAQAGRDAGKLEALLLDPALKRKVREQFPDNTELMPMLDVCVDDMLILAKHGVFLEDPNPFEDL